MISRRTMLGALAAVPLSSAPAAGDDWVPLFNGRNLDGWKAAENPDTWKVVDGTLSSGGPRSHLFYSGPVRGAGFRNFELKFDVKARKGANSGVYIHTAWQEKGWPEQGFEVQINNTHVGEGSYRERKKGGSLYGVRNVYKQLAGDDEWFPMQIAVRGKNVQIRVKDMLVVDYVEPNPPVQAAKTPGRVLGSGTFALQGHDPHSQVSFRNILVRPLPDDIPTPGDPPVVDEKYRQLLELSAQNYPVVDYHVHVRPPAWTVDEALRESRRLGIGYGIATNGGRQNPVQTDDAARRYLALMKNQPCFVAMQAEGREWVTMFSAEVLAQFDYIFTDGMTWTDDNGKRMRLWIKDEVGEIRDVQGFMDTLVNRTVGILKREPIDIYVNPTFLPDVIASSADQLWTGERMRQVIDAAVKNDVAIELNTRYRLPSPAFVKLAKSMGAKFTFGTNNEDRKIGRSDYGLEMVQECGLRWQDFFVPRPDGQKPIQTRGLPKS